MCETRLPLDLRSPLSAADGSAIRQGLRTAGFAEKVVVHASQIVRIPREVPLESAALLACGVITGLGAVLNTAKVEPGAKAVLAEYDDFVSHYEVSLEATGSLR